MPLKTEPLIFEDEAPQTAILRLLEEMQSVASTVRTESADTVSAKQTAETIDKIARSMSSTIKCLSDLQDQNARSQKATAEKHYTRYEDLPPPSPEDRRRFLERLDTLVAEIETIPDTVAALDLEARKQ